MLRLFSLNKYLSPTQFNPLPGSSILALTTGVGPLTTRSQYPAASRTGTARTAAIVTIDPENGEMTFMTRRVNDGLSGDVKVSY